MKLRSILCGIAILLANTAVHAAGAVVWFVDGRTLAVESLSFDDDVACARGRTPKTYVRATNAF